MSSVIAMIYHGEICLASDTMSTDHETGLTDEPVVKQIIINNNTAIGFAGSGSIAQVIMKTLQSPKNAEKVSKAKFNDIPLFLDDIYQAYIVGKQFPDEETRHISSLIIGFNGNIPEITYWDNINGAKPINQDHPDNFTAFILNPFDMTQSECNKILWDIITSYSDLVSLYDTAVNYFKVVSSRSKFVSETATIWTHPTFRVIDTF